MHIFISYTRIWNLVASFVNSIIFHGTLLPRYKLHNFCVVTIRLINLWKPYCVYFERFQTQTIFPSIFYKFSYLFSWHFGLQFQRDHRWLIVALFSISFISSIIFLNVNKPDKGQRFDFMRKIRYRAPASPARNKFAIDMP